MRIVIDKDVSEIKLLQESFEKSRPTYKVRAVNKDDKFIYAKDLKRIDEATTAVFDVAFDPAFSDCHSEIIEVSEGVERTIWSSDEKTMVVESAFVSEEGEEDEKKGFWAKLGDKAKGALKGLGKAFNFVGTLTKNFSKDMLKKWRDAKYFTKDGQLSGLGYKVATG